LTFSKMPMAGRWLPPIPCALSPQAPVSAPLLPRELRPSLPPRDFEHNDCLCALERKGDLWADFWKRRQRLEQAIRTSQSTHAAQNEEGAVMAKPELGQYISSPYAPARNLLP